MQLEIEQEMLMENEMSDLTKRKTLGISHLENNNFKEAVNIYKSILTDYPNDIESYLLLGDLYLANEDNLAAKKVYEKALTIDSTNLVIQRRINITLLELNQNNAGQIPTDSVSVSLLLQGLTGRQTTISETEIRNAADLLDNIVHAQNPAEMVANHLEQIDTLLPALIELNIRQAKNDRRLDLVNLLQALQENINVQIEKPKQDEGNKSTNGVEFTSTQNNRFSGHVKILVPDANHISERVRSITESLSLNSCTFSLHDTTTESGDTRPALVIATNPHIDPKIMETLAAMSAQQIPIILDLDEDFENIPVTHPDYGSLGLGSLNRSRAYTASLLLANLITIPGETMSAHLKEMGHKVEVIPFSWSNKNEYWQKPPTRRNSLNIGLVGVPGQYEDVQKYRRVITRTLREFQQTRLVVCGDPITYKMFENIPENRRVFLPRVPEEDVPYVLGQIDILLVPLNNSPFHLVQTDRLLMQAGVKNIPWIASPIPDFIKWQVGGVTADSPEEWHSYLRQFIQDEEIRSSLGAAGQCHAEERENSKTSSKWFNVLNGVFLEANSKH